MQARSFITCSLVSCWLLSAQGAVMAADCPVVPDDPVAARKLASEMFAQAAAAYRRNGLEEAIDDFFCSLRARPHFNTLFNIAEATKASSDKEHTLTLLEGYVADNPGSEIVLDVKMLANHLASNLGRVPPFGDLAQPGGNPEENSANMSGAANAREDASPADEPDRTAPDDETKAGKDEGKKTSVKKILGASLLGAGLAAGVAGVILQVNAGKARDGKSSASTPDDRAEQTSKVNKLQALAIVSMAGGAILVTTSVILLVKNRRRSDSKGEKPEEPDVSLSAGPASLELTLRF